MVRLSRPPSSEPDPGVASHPIRHLAAEFPLTTPTDLFGDDTVEPAGLDTATAHRLVPVVLPVALDQSYDYVVPAGLELAPGQFVHVPFGAQHRIGIVWDRPAGLAALADAKPVPLKKLKAVLEVLDVPPLAPVQLRFTEWIARYTIAPLGLVARMMMGASSAFEPQKSRSGVAIVPDAGLPPRMSPERQRALKVAGDGQVRAKSKLAAEAKCTTAVVDGLIKSGNLVEVALAASRMPIPRADHTTVTFSPDQERAVHALRAAVDARGYSVSLIDGVTGSGKTEVYYEAVARTLEQGRQVAILLPEIALTSQFMRRFDALFGCAPVEWHSALSPGARGRTWLAAAKGDARVVVGARSALFLPYQDLGLIVVDEEHDTGFKQDDGVHYQGRDMAVARGALGKIPVVLASATPSIESHVNARTGRYRHLVLPGRFSGTELPAITPINMRETPPERGRWLAPALVEALKETMAEGKQALLFLNRRGYAPLTLCRGCGLKLECPQCTAWLVEHRFKRRLGCHHCGFQLPIPEKCPKCGEADSLVPCGPGVERIAEEVRERFPEARLALLSSDLIPGLVEMRAMIREIEAGEIDIIIGTQMVAKGHHFPNLATVGVVDGDLGLAQGGDPRAAERTFQLLHQVTGRAGRSFANGRGFIQTFDPGHPVMQAIISGDRETFLDREIMMRQATTYPPYGRLVSLIVSARDREQAEGYARDIALCAPPAERVEVMGPAEAPIAIVRGRHRWRLLAKAPREIDIQAYMRAWLAEMPPAKGDLRLAVDVDPYNFL